MQQTTYRRGRPRTLAAPVRVTTSLDANTHAACVALIQRGACKTIAEAVRLAAARAVARGLV